MYRIQLPVTSYDVLIIKAGKELSTWWVERRKLQQQQHRRQQLGDDDDDDKLSSQAPRHNQKKKSRLIFLSRQQMPINSGREPVWSGGQLSPFWRCSAAGGLTRSLITGRGDPSAVSDVHCKPIVIFAPSTSPSLSLSLASQSGRTSVVATTFCS